MSEPRANQDRPALHLLDMAIDHIVALLTLLRSHHAALSRESASDLPAVEAPRHSEDGVWNDDDIPF